MEIFQLINFINLDWNKGAVSAHYHILIPQSRQLIRRAICLSGTAFLRYSYLDTNTHLDKMYEFADNANASVQNFNELKRSLKQVPADTIVRLLSQTSFDRTLTFDWAPMIESKFFVSLFSILSFVFLLNLIHKKHISIQWREKKKPN